MKVTAAALLAALLPSAAGAQVEVLHEGGPAGNRINLVILGDGYTEAEQDDMSEDAARVTADFFAVSPWAEYISFFNVKLVHAVSAESGSDHPSRGELRDTAFGSTFECSGIDRLICVNAFAVLTAAAEAVPEVTLAIVMVNDEQYGGSGGEVAAVSVHRRATEILRHELAHSIADLADEYETPFPGYPHCDPVADCAEPNVTLRTEREAIKWRAWIDEATPVPTPDSFTDAVGLFEGARFLSEGVYRPEHGCNMRALADPFCRVCTEAMVASFYDRVNPLDAAEPQEPVVLAWSERTTLRVEHPQTADGSVAVTWWVDGAPLAGSGPALEADAAVLGTGAHVVTARVEDVTERVRADLGDLLRAEASFTVDATAGACGDGIENGPEACDDGNRAPGDGCSETCAVEARASGKDAGCACGSGGATSASMLALLVTVLFRRRRGVAPARRATRPAMKAAARTRTGRYGSPP